MTKPMARYEEIPHTADVRLRIFGADERELFANAAFALSDSLVDLSGVRAEISDSVEATGGDIEETLINFLSELLYRFDGEGRAYSECRIDELSDVRVAAVCSGEALDPARHHRRKGIKAVTFHDVNIARDERGLSVVITFDV